MKIKIFFLIFFLLLNSVSYSEIQLNSESFRQDEFKGEPAQRIIIREHRRIQKNSLVSSDRDDAVHKPKIVTSITPIASVVAMLVKDEAVIDSLAVNSSCPHHYHLKPSDLAKVKNADIAIYIDGLFDSFAEKLMQGHSKNIIKISDIKSLKIIKDNNEPNWHIWLDIENVKILLQELSLILAQKLPNLREDINKNLHIALKQLEDLNKMKNRKFEGLQDVILLSDSAEYFFIDTKIKTQKLYSVNQKSLKYVSKLEELLSKSANKCLILDTQQDARLYKKLNANIVTLESENWSIVDINHRVFYEQYLQMINQFEICIKIAPFTQ
ncbi:metal ABC transporter solute-binding protein, Zn/Mn family [Rickettsia endosymbiont of Polydrusus tereticollis]|uniref:metal ABC transporter solute-binding protein, Zn/Mn family n=1 Tax=Rickettsia endosymbiont of Polydrusus tereticollis TaxID=3066251 RepID=UPI0031329DD2